MTLSESGGSEEAVRARVNAAWLKWKEFTGVIHDKRMPRKLKVKTYETVIRPALLYGAELRTLRKKEERMLATTEIKMLCRIMGVTLLDRRRNEDIRRELKVDEILLKIQQARLRWYGHLLRMSEQNPVKQAWKWKVEGSRPRGRPRKRWMENVRDDMKLRQLCDQDAENRTL